MFMQFPEPSDDVLCHVVLKGRNPYFKGMRFLVTYKAGLRCLPAALQKGLFTFNDFLMKIFFWMSSS